MMLSYSITICTFNQHSHFSFLTSKNEPFFHLPARFFLGSQEVGVVEEIWNKTLGLGDLPRRARSERCFWAAFLAQRKIRASHRAPWKFQAEHPLLMRNITNSGTVFVMIWCGFAGDFITPMQHVRSPRENEQLTRFLH